MTTAVSTLSPRIYRSNTIDDLPEGALATGIASLQSRREWDDLISKTLDAWARNIEEITDVDYTPPSLEIIAFARWIAEQMRDLDLPAPTRIVPNGEGGISFEREAGGRVLLFEVLEIESDFSTRLQQFENFKCVFSQSFPWFEAYTNAA